MSDFDDSKTAFGCLAGGLVLWIAGFLVFWGVVIWAIIQLVNFIVK